MTDRTCQTPEAVYSFHIQSTAVSINVENLPLGEVTEEGAVRLEDEIHDALEAVLKRLYAPATKQDQERCAVSDGCVNHLHTRSAVNPPAPHQRPRQKTRDIMTPTCDCSPNDSDNYTTYEDGLEVARCVICDTLLARDATLQARLEHARESTQILAEDAEEAIRIMDRIDMDEANPQRTDVQAARANLRAALTLLQSAADTMSAL